MERKRRLFRKVEFRFINMSHWGHIYIIPNLSLVVTYSQPTVTFEWWVFRVDVIIYRRFPDWFMKYVWSTLNLDFGWMKRKGDEEDC